MPWSRGRDFEADEEWDPTEFPLPEAVRDALFVNLLTEDNLPYYFAHIDKIFGPGVWGEWIRRWTAEEQRHSIVIRDYLTVTRALDPVELERGRMAQVSGAVVPRARTPADTLVYVALQELATRVSHRNTGKLIGDPVGYEVMARVAADENLHYLFYRDLVSEAHHHRPVGRGAGHRPAGAGVRDARDGHPQLQGPGGVHRPGRDLRPLPPLRPGPGAGGARHWKLEEVEGLSAEAEEARSRVLPFMAGWSRSPAASATPRPTPTGIASSIDA